MGWDGMVRMGLWVVGSLGPWREEAGERADEVGARGRAEKWKKWKKWQTVQLLDGACEGRLRLRNGTTWDLPPAPSPPPPPFGNSPLRLSTHHQQPTRRVLFQVCDNAVGQESSNSCLVTYHHVPCGLT